VRVPVERYKEFLAAVRELGEVRSITSDSKDVTAEFFDVDARVRNKQREEERLLKLLEEATGKLNDILEVERELSRVRGEIEQLQGRLRVLKDLTSLTTIDIRIDEIKDYVPESPEGPSYWTRVRRAFSNSISELVAAAQAVSIAIVAAAPWLGVALVFVLLILFVVKIIRWFWRRSS
jgi:predicted nuclease with TOPRIM domain